MGRRSFRPFGGSGTKLKLNSKDIVKITFNLILYLLFFIAIFQASVIVVNRFVYNHPNVRDFVWGLRRSIGLSSFKIPFILILGALFGIWSLFRIKKYMEKKQMDTIIAELHYIARGNYNHQISIRPKGDLGYVVDSIHALVKSTVDAMEEERKLERSKDELVTNVSHDLRTPLTSIIGYLGLIEEQKYQNESQLLQYTNIAYNKAKQMNVLVNALFEYTKVRNRGAHLNMTGFDLVELLNQVATGFQVAAEEAGMELIVDTPDQLKIEMQGDTDKLVRVVENLIANAVKYGRGGSQIVIKVVPDRLGATFSVANNGEPIPEQALPNLFERFYRLEASRSLDTGGSGLGLAIAKGIIDLHHGTISVTSDPSWTTFTVWLPSTFQQPNKQL